MARITTQTELDAALARDPSGTFEIEGSDSLSVTLPTGTPRFKISGSVMFIVEARGNARVEARDNTSVVARDNTSVVARDNTSVVARDNTSVVARDNTSVVAGGNASVVARDNTSVEASGNARVEASGNTSVVAGGNARVEARGNARVEARGNARVEARGNARVEARDNTSVVAGDNTSVVAGGNARVEASGNTRVEAGGNVFIRLFSALKITASIGVVVKMHGSAETIDGGHQIPAVPEPGNNATGAEWAEFHGIPANAPFKVENIDARIATAIDAGQGELDMNGWHGDECDEDNWCGTSHCRAGYAICLAGKEGFELERKYGAETAGRMIYAVSRPNEPLPDFFAINSEALADIREAAARQAEPSADNGQ